MATHGDHIVWHQLGENWLVGDDNTKLSALLQPGIREGYHVSIGSTPNVISIAKGVLLTRQGDKIELTADRADTLPITANSLGFTRRDLIVCYYHYTESDPGPQPIYQIITGTADDEFPGYDQFRTPLAVGIIENGASTYTEIIQWPTMIRYNHDVVSGVEYMRHGNEVALRLKLIRTPETTTTEKAGMRVEMIPPGTLADGAAIQESDWVAAFVLNAEGEVHVQDLLDEIVQARGDHSTLDERLDISLNDDGTLKAEHNDLADMGSPGTITPLTTAIPGITLSYPFGTGANASRQVAYSPNAGQLGSIGIDNIAGDHTVTLLRRGQTKVLVTQGDRQNPEIGCIAEIDPDLLPTVSTNRHYEFVHDAARSTGHDSKYEPVWKREDDSLLSEAMRKMLDTRRTNRSLVGAAGGIMPVLGQGGISSISGLTVTISETMAIFGDVTNVSQDINAFKYGDQVNIAETGIAVSDNSTITIYINNKGRVAATGSFVYTMGIPLYEITTASGAVTAIKDLRQWVGEGGTNTIRRQPGKGAQAALPVATALTGFQGDLKNYFGNAREEDRGIAIEVSAKLRCDLVADTMYSNTTLDVNRDDWQVGDLLIIARSDLLHRVTAIGVGNRLTIDPPHPDDTSVVADDQIWQVHLIDGVSDWRHRLVRMSARFENHSSDTVMPGEVYDYGIRVGYDLYDIITNGIGIETGRGMVNAFFYTSTGKTLKWVDTDARQPLIVDWYYGSSPNIYSRQVRVAVDPVSGALMMAAGPRDNITLVDGYDVYVNAFIEAGIKRS